MSTSRTPWHERADALQTLILIRWHWSVLDVVVLLALVAAAQMSNTFDNLAQYVRSIGRR